MTQSCTGDADRRKKERVHTPLPLEEGLFLARLIGHTPIPDWNRPALIEEAKQRFQRARALWNGRGTKGGASSSSA